MAHHHDDINNLDTLLQHHGLRKTAFRKEVLDIFRNRKGQALSQGDIEQNLDHWDRITLYRTLKSFEDKGLIHQTPEVNGTTKYALCGQKCSSHHHDDGHAHFHCLKCNVTQCVHEAVESLSYNLPENYSVKEVKVMLSGTCASCG